MIKSITVTNPKNESLKLILKNPIASGGIAVLDVDGLGPPKASVNSTVISTMDGVRINSVRAGSRNVVLTLAFVGTDVEAIRHETYRYFPLKKTVGLTIETDHRTLETYGTVESNEPDIFSQQEGTSISIVCEESFLRASDNYGLTVEDYYDVHPQFTFPFENSSGSGSLTEKVIEFSRIDMSQSESIHYWGDVDTGAIFHITALGPVVTPSVFNPDTGQILTIDSDKVADIMGSGIVSGDEIFISTVKGQKSVTLERSGSPYNIMNALGTNVSWIQLESGDNTISYKATSGVENIRFEVIYRPLFEGV